MRISKARMFVVVSLVAAGAVSAAPAAVRLPRVFGDDMVLQRQMPVPVWGWAEAGQKVIVTFAGQAATATAAADGKWMLKLEPLEASDKPATMIVTAGDDAKVTLKNVLVGEVWLGSGQSNMEMSVGGCLEAAKFIAEAKYPDIRLFTVRKRPAGEAQDDVEGRWGACSPQAVGGFSAVLFFFGRRIHKELGVPVGLVHSSWGGTRIEPWTPPCGFRAVASLAAIAKQVEDAPGLYRRQVRQAVPQMEAWLAKAKEALAGDGKLPPAPPLPRHPLDSSGAATGLYNGMIHGLIPFALRGALWYQGESNGGEGRSYFEKKRALIGGWRELWGQGAFAFYFVQLADFMAPNADPAGGDGWARLREAQTACLSIPNTGMAVLTDIGDAKDIHPKNKQDVGERLALWALAKDYGKKDLVYSGPLYKGSKAEGAKMVISFDHVGSGLMVGRKEGLAPTQEVPGAALKGFSIRGDDGQWHWADARIVADTVVVSSDKVAKPLGVRYAFTTNTDACNLYNKEGLPASPFRTDGGAEWSGGK
jgi:sialate O-acetylesterase